YDSTFLSQISINNFLGTGSQPPIFFHENEQFQLQVKILGGSLTDSTFYFPNRENPDLVLMKNGNFLDAVQVKLENEFSATKYKSSLEFIDSSFAIFDLAEKHVVIVKN